MYKTLNSLILVTTEGFPHTVSLLNEIAVMLEGKQIM